MPYDVLIADAITRTSLMNKEEIERYIEKVGKAETLKWWPFFITIGFVVGTFFGIFIKS